MYSMQYYSTSSVYSYFIEYYVLKTEICKIWHQRRRAALLIYQSETEKIQFGEAKVIIPNPFVRVYGKMRIADSVTCGYVHGKMQIG